MRDKIKQDPLIIDSLIVVYLCIALWYVYKGDIFGYSKSFAIIPAAYARYFLPIMRLQMEIFAVIYAALGIGLYFFRKWAFYALLILNTIAIFTAPAWAKAFCAVAIICFIFEREYFGVGGFIRPEAKNIIHVEYDHDTGLDRIDIEERQDLRMEDMISRDELEEALSYARGMIDVARVMGDVRNVIYYEKYLDKIYKIKNRIIR
jgi:hypothetical protein